MRIDKRTIDQLVLPGQVVGRTEPRALDYVSPNTDSKSHQQQQQFRLGPGLSRNPRSASEIIAVIAGVFRVVFPEGAAPVSGSTAEENESDFWMDVPNSAKVYVQGHSKHYVPRVGDSVIGIVSSRNVEAYAVDIGSSLAGMLPVLAFDGATKRSKPNLQIGDYVYARVVAFNVHQGAALSCTSPASLGAVGAKDWITKESVFGQLFAGHVVPVSIPHAFQLLRKTAPILAAIGKHVSYECAVGANGRVWIDASSTRETILVSSAIEASEWLHDDECSDFVQRLLVVHGA
eukprot:ANDGO_04059.mRNA.1 Putative exosome complex component rrp40